MVIDPAWVEEIKDRIPELPAQRRTRLVQEYSLPEYDAGLLTGSKAMADFYEAAVGARPQTGQPVGDALDRFAKNVSNWILGDLSRLLNLENVNIAESKVSPAHLAELIGLVDSETISVTMAKTVLEEAFQSGEAPAKIVQDRGYSQISDSDSVEAAVRQAIEANPKAVDDYMQGKETASRFLVGQVMKITRGQAKPELVNELVRKTLEALKNNSSPPLVSS